MRTLLFVLGLYMAHRVLALLSPAYAERMRSLDRQLTWVSVILVVYLLVNVVIRFLAYGH
jgi:heme/copper-type cytochrome/quinol oxidase subunit 2